MTYADEQKAFIAGIIQTLRSAAGNGMAAVTSAQDGLRALVGVVDELKASRTYALQELGELQEIHNKLQALFSNTLDSDVSEAISSFQDSQDKVEAYANKLQLQIQALEQIGLVINYKRVEDEMNASGQTLEAGSLALARYVDKI